MSNEHLSPEPKLTDYLAKWSKINIVAYEQENSARLEYATDKLNWQARKIADMEREWMDLFGQRDFESAKGWCRLASEVLKQTSSSKLDAIEAGMQQPPPPDNYREESARTILQAWLAEYGSTDGLSISTRAFLDGAPAEPVAVQSTDLLLQPESKEPETVLPDGMITVPKGHFWRSPYDRFVCQNCGQTHDEHIHSDMASLCPREPSTVKDSLTVPKPTSSKLAPCRICGNVPVTPYAWFKEDNQWNPTGGGYVWNIKCPGCLVSLDADAISAKEAIDTWNLINTPLLPSAK
jgi:hypothetical protein